MASQQSPPPPPPVDSPPPPAPTTVFDLGNDLLCEIFLRLPSLPSLVRAALSCSTFLHAVRSSPAFRRSFSAARPPPLLGLFFDPEGPAMPAFAPLRRRSDPDLAAVVRGADFFLTRLPDDDDIFPGWVIEDCRDGYVLLGNLTAVQFAVYNPLTRFLDLIPHPPGEIFDDSHGATTFLECYILSPEESAQPLRVVYTGIDESRARAAVFSSDSREWQIFPWSEPVAPVPQPEHQPWLKVGRMVNGFVYWVHANEAYILVLNTATLEFSHMDLPPSLVGRDFKFRIGETKNGELCIVCPIEFDLFLWVWRAGLDGIQTWMFDKRFSLETIVDITEGSLEEHGELRIVDIIAGYVYFSTNETFDDARHPCWFLSLCMETEELDTIFQKRFDSHIYPYIMAWPTFLIENKAHPQLEGA